MLPEPKAPDGEGWAPLLVTCDTEDNRHLAAILYVNVIADPDGCPLFARHSGVVADWREANEH